MLPYFHRTQFPYFSLIASRRQKRPTACSRRDWCSRLPLFQEFDPYCKIALQLRGEAFNIFNQVQCGFPARSASSTIFWEITCRPRITGRSRLEQTLLPVPFAAAHLHTSHCSILGSFDRILSCAHLSIQFAVLRSASLFLQAFSQVRSTRNRHRARESQRLSLSALTPSAL